MTDITINIHADEWLFYLMTLWLLVYIPLRAYEVWLKFRTFKLRQSLRELTKDVVD